MTRSLAFAILTATVVTACGQGTYKIWNQADETVREPTGNIPPSPNDTSKFVEPTPTPDQVQQIMAGYKYVDPSHAIPSDLLQTAIVYFDYNKQLIPNTAYLTVVDFSAYSGTTRFHIIDMKTGAVTSTYVAHGTNSDPNATGYATRFSNTPNSDESSLGMYLTAETYQGDHPGLSLRLDGLSITNSNVRSRAIVIHGATYVYDQAVKQGRSFGCLALAMDVHDQIITQLQNGSLIYAGLHGAAQPGDEAAYLVQGARDIGGFCGKYTGLTSNQKVTFWGYAASAISKYESGFNPDDRSLESTMRIGPITGLVSLLQSIRLEYRQTSEPHRSEKNGFRSR